MNGMSGCVALAGALIAGGCASGTDYATFVTKTSVSVVDVDSTPPSASLGYERVEGYLGPRLADGRAVPVVGFIRTDGKLMDRSLEQVYATGCAAEIVTAQSVPATPPPGSACVRGKPTNQVLPMLFATGTVFGVAISVSQSSAPSLTLGYRRKEGSIVPVDDTSMPSVLARHGNWVQAPSGTDTNTQLGFSQYFATGLAADALAKVPEVGQLFKTEAKNALGVYRDNERAQSVHVLTTLSCLAATKDDQFPAVWANAVALGLLSKDSDASAPAKVGVASSKAFYTKQLAILNADSADWTTLVGVHRRFVCDLAKT
jgi:hypothetical protein